MSILMGHIFLCIGNSFCKNEHWLEDWYLVDKLHIISGGHELNTSTRCLMCNV